MVRMGGCATGNHADKIARCNGVGSSPANPLAGVFAFDAAFGKGQATGTHTTVFATDALGANIAGFHCNSPVKSRLNAQIMRPLNHLLTGRINGYCYRISQFFRLGLF